MKKIKWGFTTFIFLFIVGNVFSRDFFSVNCNSTDGFPINQTNSICIYYDPNDAEVVKISANLLCSDIEMIVGQKPRISTSADDLGDYTIIVGSIGNNELINQLSETGVITTSNIEGKWECYHAKTIDQPTWGGQKALVIAGSDRRGTAYGIFELSKAIGVSPWYWWADVTPQQKEEVNICPIDAFSSEPTVKFRGIFINDEDWGLQEWAQYTYDPIGDIGPTTYEKVFELLLRLKANYIWPAMHPCTQSFNFYADNKVVADKYAIVMGSSHHEPLLYNTEEWPYSTSSWNAFTNLDVIMGVLEDRVQNNCMYENVYTVGIRGAGDGGMSGASSLDAATEKTEEVIDLERNLLTTYVDPTITNVPQVFWPYKEVLDIYNNNMDLPDDITLGWVDDNHGYVRQVSNPTEQQRSGGSGVYYHVSYWGSPSDYLWITSTQPALIATEMKKAADFGGDRIWIFNVGDIKPAEMVMNFCLDMAWDYNEWDAHNVREYINQWVTYQFGDTYAESITNIYMKYFQLAQAAKPEHMNLVSFSDNEIDDRLAAYEEIAATAEDIYNVMPSDLADAFYETVYYPIMGANLMNQKFLYAYKSIVASQNGDENTTAYAEKAVSAYNAIIEKTDYYNTGIKDGKWNKIISCDIRDQDVYDMPTVATEAYIEYANIDLSSGTFVSPMKYENDLVFGDKTGLQSITTGGKAEFTFEMEEAAYAEIYFYAKTPTPEEDSWYITLNGSQSIQNNYATGDSFEWIKVKSQVLVAGTNTLVISQREPNAQIAAIKITNAQLSESTENENKSADIVIPAWEFTNKHDAQNFVWETIEGLSTSEKAVVNLPYTSVSLTSVTGAPYIEQNIDLTNNSFTLEVRCMPTRRLYEGRDLRIAISIDDSTPEIISINHAYPTSQWAQNVLQGFTNTALDYTDDDLSVNVKLYALDPGVIFDKVLIYYDESSSTPTSISEDIEKTNRGVESIYPNPCDDILFCNLGTEYSGVINYSIFDISGRAVLTQNKKINHQDKFAISTESLKSGIYILNVNNDKTKQSFLFKRK